MIAAFPGATALVVDDSPTMRRQLGEILRRLGLACDEAQDGADAWRKLAVSQYDLVVTDINMPVMDGLKLISLVRAVDAHRAMPVIVISTEGAQADRARALGRGADAYLVKPVQTQQVAELVRRLLAAVA